MHAPLHLYQARASIMKTFSTADVVRFGVRVACHRFFLSRLAELCSGDSRTFLHLHSKQAR